MMVRGHRLSLVRTFVLLGAFSLVSCDDDDNDGGGGGGGPTFDLAAADFPGVTPCPNQEILTDGVLFAELVDALRNGTFLYLDVPFNAGDANIFVKKCGLGAAWNPTQNIDEVAPVVVPVTIQGLYQTGNAGICATGFNHGSFGTGEGFPAAGTYRKEFKVNNAGTTWHVRVRLTISGTAAGRTFADEGVAFPAGISNLIYHVEGVETAHDDVLTAVVDALQISDGAQVPEVTIEVRKNAMDPAILTVLAEVLCAAKL